MTAKGIIVSIFAFVLGAATLAGEERRLLAEVDRHEAGMSVAAVHIEGNDTGRFVRNVGRAAPDTSGYSVKHTSIDPDRSHCESDPASRVRITTKQVDVTN